MLTIYTLTIEIKISCIKTAVVQIRTMVNNLDHAYEVARFEYGAIRVLSAERGTISL